MVSEVSAIDVASTTLRRPSGDGEMARSWVCASSAPYKVTISTAGSVTISLSAVSARRISAWPGRNARIEPASARSARATVSATCRSIITCGSRPR